MALCNIAGHVQHTAWHGIAQHSTAQHTQHAHVEMILPASTADNTACWASRQVLHNA